MLTNSSTYKAEWRPLLPQFPQATPPVPSPAESALATPAKAVVKATGAYSAAPQAQGDGPDGGEKVVREKKGRKAGRRV